MAMTSSLLTICLLLLLLTTNTLAEPPDKERTHIWLTPWADTSCQGVPAAAPFPPFPSEEKEEEEQPDQPPKPLSSTRRSTFQSIHLLESLKDGGICAPLSGHGSAFSSFSYTLGQGLLGGKLFDRIKPGREEEEGRGRDEKSGGMCILEIYKGTKCGTRQAGLWGGWEEERPLMVVWNATSSEYGNLDKCHRLKDLTQHTARSVFFDCRMSWISDYIVPHLDGEDTN